MRGYLRPLLLAGAVEKRRHGGFPGTFDYRLTPAGSELLEVASVVGAWLARSSRPALSLGSDAAKPALRLLVESWATGIAPVLAAVEAVSLTQLSRSLPALSYPALERRVSSMRRLGLVRSLADRQAPVPLAATDWMRASVAPVTASMSWRQELLQAPRGTIEAGLRYALALARLQPSAGGTCRLEVHAAGEPSRALVELTVELEKEAATVASDHRGGTSTAEINGSVGDWIEALVKGNEHGLSFAGEPAVAAELVGAMHDGIRER